MRNSKTLAWTVFLLMHAVPAICQTPGSGADLRLKAGTGMMIDYSAEITRIATSNPDVVDPVAVSSREILLNAKAAGIASVFVWSATGERTHYSVTVDPNLDAIQNLLNETFPNERIRVQAARDSVSLTGRVSSQAVADRAAALVAPLGKIVVNNVQVASEGPQKQILLHVKFAELNRSASSAFGVNVLSTGAANTPGLTTTGQFASPRPTEIAGTIPGRASGTASKFTISEALNIFAFRPDLNLAAFIKALQTSGLLQILAEPNLVTTNGKEASFLVGGEFPVPVVQAGLSAGALTIQFREFGIRLTFQPVITPHNTIKLHVKPEVSTIDLANAVVFSGYTIPALATRRMETHIELGQGQSFVIAGLMDDRVTESLSRVPGLAHIPVLGALFKSRQQNKSKTELMVIVTPEITTPQNVEAMKDIEMPVPFLEPLPGAAKHGSGPEPRAGKVGSK